MRQVDQTTVQQVDQTMVQQVRQVDQTTLQQVDHTTVKQVRQVDQNRYPTIKGPYCCNVFILPSFFPPPPPILPLPLLPLPSLPDGSKLLAEEIAGEASLLAQLTRREAEGKDCQAHKGRHLVEQRYQKVSIRPC